MASAATIKHLADGLTLLANEYFSSSLHFAEAVLRMLVVDLELSTASISLFRDDITVSVSFLPVDLPVAFPTPRTSTTVTEGVGRTLDGGDEAPRRRTASARRQKANDLLVVVPIEHAGDPLGELRAAWSGGDPPPVAPGVLTEFVRMLTPLLMRYDVEAWAIRATGTSIRLVGMSRALCEVEAFAEIAAQSDLPVLLLGEFGTETLQVAAAIHRAGVQRDLPFVEINCAEPGSDPSHWFEAAAGGTVFLSGVDALPVLLQQRLPLVMRSHFGQWLNRSPRLAPKVVASTSVDLRRRADEGGFSRALLAELDCLSVVIAPLRERPEDIEPLITAALERRGFRAARKRSYALVDACQAYSWPENVFELERVLARLAVMTGDHAIGHDEIVLHAPWLLAASEPPGAPDTAPRPEAPSPGHWIECTLRKDREELDKLHHALRRALLYLADCYAEPVSLAHLAREARVSQSHLSFLFRSELQMRFKALLVQIRVRKAMELLAADARLRITEVAMVVGFADLSHFERSFRRIAGQSPSAFRRQCAASPERRPARGMPAR